MADNIRERKCPNCGAPLRFDPKSGNLLCDYCDSQFTIEQVEAAEGGQEVQEMDFQEAAASLENYKVYLCKSCGAEIICDPQTVALTCPYCGNNIVLMDKVSGSLTPDGVLPFRITPEKLPAAVREFYKGKLLLPRNFFSDSSIGKVQGIYVPFWLYDAAPEGPVTLNGETVHCYRQGDYEVTDTSYYRLHRSVGMRFKNVPVDASEKMDDALMDSLEPYDFSQIKAFDTAYLSGYLADRFDKNADEVRARADKRIMNTALSVVESRTAIGYSGISVEENGLDLSKNTARYVLLPVYIFDINYKGEAYSFAVNGQTGKVVGTLPSDKSVKRSIFLKGAGIAAAVLMALNYLLALR